MIKFLIDRPIAVFMTFTALFILGIITSLNLPVSLLPNISIPEITVQIISNNNSAREIENIETTVLRRQLMQVSNLRNIETETRDGKAIIHIDYEYGTNIDLAFIEANEKIDAAMNYLPKETIRPQVIKASATDIPVFNLNLTLRDSGYNQTKFLELCEFAETVIKRRIEQLPQVSMVDITGIMHKQVLIVPNTNAMEITGVTQDDIKNALANNNIELGSMVVREGHYEYHVRFSTVLRTLEDIQQIYLRKNDHVFQLKDLVSVTLEPVKEKGMALYNGKRAVCMSVIKQSNESMQKMEKTLNAQIAEFKASYPDIEFSISQNQTTLLDFTISNLEQNMLLAFLFVCLASALFLKDLRSPLIMGFSIIISLAISLLFFYLCHLSLNVVSLTGLMLALGMMIDNSIIVTDNIGQYRANGLSLAASCIRGTNEVITPMLSSALTTIAVFVPLVFMSGITGALFYDQAFSITVGLLVSYLVGIFLIPVLYKSVFSIKKKQVIEKTAAISGLEKIYHRGVHWVFRHKIVMLMLSLLMIPLCFVLFYHIPKEKMPAISQNELLVEVEWNENLPVEENLAQSQQFIKTAEKETQLSITENSALIAQQQFMLKQDRTQSSSETQFYFKTKTTTDIPKLKQSIQKIFKENYPHAIISFKPVGTVFEKIFVTGEPDLRVRSYSKNRTTYADAASVKLLQTSLEQLTHQVPVGTSFQKQLNIHINRPYLLLYHVDYDEVYQILKTGFKENQFATLRSYQQYLPIVLGGEEKNVQTFINQTMVSTHPDHGQEKMQLPLSYFVSTSSSEDLKTIVAGKNGEYIPFDFFNDKDVKQQIAVISKNNNNSTSPWDIDFTGSFFSNQKMMGELVVILIISLLLMYFIMAAQFEDFVRPFIVLLEIPIDIAASLGILMLCGETLNLMSAIGIVVTCGIVINDSILKIDVMKQLQKEGVPLIEAIHQAGHRRLKAILMTSLTSIVCMVPLLFSSDMGSELEQPLAIAMIAGMFTGTLVSLFIVPLFYWFIYKNKK